MASPPTFPISTPQSSNTTITAASSQSLSSFINHVSSQFRPWSELIDPNSFSRPGTLSEAYSRILNNHSYFMPNYVTVICITLVHSLATYPLLLLLIVFLSFWTFICLSRTSPQTVVLFGRTFSESKTLSALVVATVFLTDFISLLTSGLMLGLSIVFTHAAFRVPHQDLFLRKREEPSPARDLFLLERAPGPDHDQELSSAGFRTNFIPMVSDKPSSSSSSSSSSPPQTKYDVFLSFRGDDSRYSFTSHLYAELRSKNIETFIDDKLGKGKLIWPALQTAIEESMIYVIIFSPHYASSKWCLDELTKILECKEKYGRTVIPVFYNVDPSTVRNQRGSYAAGLIQLEVRCMEKVPGWKRALTQAAAHSGWDLNTIRNESKLVTKIVKDLQRRLSNSPSSDYKGLIGIPEHITQIESFLHVESASVRVIGICGIGGIGKTTIAGALYQKLATQFSFHCFVANFEEDIKRYGGVHRMQRKYLSKLLGKKPGDSRGLWVELKLKRRKVLLILDNVNSSPQLQDLIDGLGSFGPGSRIIVISRDRQVLKNAADGIYEVKEMTFHDSLHLFRLYAFKQNYPIETFMDLSEKILEYAKGIPLALKTLGSFLYGRTRGEWESELQKLEKCPDHQIVNVLKLSYDGLDDEQKDIFLHIACFYRGHDMITAQQILYDSGLPAAIAMIVLVDMGLISTLNGKIEMHDLIQQMGQDIVNQQCVEEPGKRRRLWRQDDIDHFLQKKKFYKSILREDSKVYVPGSVESLPGKLRFLRRDDFLQGSLWLNFCPISLVKHDMRDSRLEQLWEGDQHFPNLRRMDPSGSRKLIQIPDLSQSPNIEELILSNCVQLDLVYSSGFLSKLNCLILNGLNVSQSFHHF